MAKMWTSNGITEPEMATVPVLDRAVLFGAGAFETLRSYDYKYFRLDEHIERFFRNLKILDIKIALDASGIKKALNETVRLDGNPDSRIKFLATAGAEGAEQGLFFIHTEKLVPFPERYYQSGVKLITSELIRNESNITTTLKSLAYLDSWWAREETKRKGGDEGLFLNTKGMLSEGASSNIFIVRESKVITPSLDQGVLPGVTRSFVLELAGSMGFQTEERLVAPNEMFEADEVFITASIKEIMPVSFVDERATGRSRKITEDLHKSYRKKLPELCNVII
ncbi:MAG: aminotransferase class IV family protein [Fibrobacteres bacterium]|nr:aminotransferase class IV family protein [Fibrobacterota bacterium]